MRVLALGTGNSVRSQMAEGWLRALSTPDVAAYSAGTRPSQVRPEAIAVMREVGIDLLGQRAKAVAEVPAPDLAISLGEDALSEDALSEGAVERLAWPIPDPAATPGDAEQRLAAFRAARDAIGARVDALLRERGLRVSFGADARPAFALRPDVTFLNHGSFGATPLPVLEAQRRLQDELEAQPVAFMRSVPARIRRVAGLVASALRADPQDLVFVDNVTTGVSAVLRSLRLGPDDVLFTTDHAYGAVRRALDQVVAHTGARLVVARVPFPLSSPAEVVDAVARALPDRARIAVFDAITSITGLVFPVDELIALCREREIPVLIDAAHAPGHLPLDLSACEADYWVGNCHKWLFAPKGCAVLRVRRDRHDQIEPLVWSHGAGQGLTAAFDFPGTRDFSAWLAMEAALEFLEPYGLDRIRAHNFGLRKAAGALVCERFGVSPPAPDEMLGSLQTLPLPFPTDGTMAAAGALNARLWERHRIEAMFMPFGGQVWLRIAAQIYNHLDEYALLAERLLD